MSEVRRGLLENLSYNLRLRRYLKGVTQADVEEATGLSTGSVSMYERGETEPLSTNLFKLARFYDTSIESLFADWIEMQRRIYGFIKEEEEHKEDK
jgi:transcriptional regulator with XRE-family HTH domain